MINLTKPHQDLINKLVDARHKSQLTQQAVANRMKTSQSAVARIESGHALPSLKTVFRYADAVGVIILFDICVFKSQKNRKILHKITEKTEEITDFSSVSGD
jgi:transcriptional regulator with XRE-family HTH domain